MAEIEKEHEALGIVYEQELEKARRLRDHLESGEKEMVNKLKTT